jgi:hypothetical protein
MKKSFLSFILLLVSFVTYAQSPTFGIRGGIDFANLLVGSLIDADGSNPTSTSNSIKTFSVGVFADFRFGNFSLQPTLVYAGKGGTFIENEGGLTQQFNLHYLELPVNIIYHIQVPIGNIYLGVGPYFAKGVNGKLLNSGPDLIIAAQQNSYIPPSENTNFGGTNFFTKADAGFDGIVGFQFKNGLLINLNYDLGMANIINNNGPRSGAVYKTRTLGLSLGYTF